MNHVLFTRFCQVGLISCFIMYGTPQLMAQDLKKLPNEQGRSLYAPAKINIDGKSTEWPGGFEAYNKATQIYYIICNDKDNLYLALQANDSKVINKIMLGGVTFTLSNSGKKKDKQNVSVTFPLAGSRSLRNMLSSIKENTEKFKDGDKEAASKRADSIMYATNRSQIDRLKEMKVIGVSSIKDSVISIYNEEGIKPRALFNIRGNYNYELAIPLKYLNGLNLVEPIFYSIRLNGPIASIELAESAGSPVDQFALKSYLGGGRSVAENDLMGMLSGTDFWARYTVASKTQN